MATILDPRYRTLLFILGLLFPIFCAILLINPGVAATLLIITIALVWRRIRTSRARREAALAERKATWGF